MTMSAHVADHELIVSPYKGGVKLLRTFKSNNSHALQLKATTVDDVFALPCNTFLMDTESKVVNGNLSNAKSMYMDNINDSIGKSIADTPCAKDSAQRIYANDRIVMQNEKASYFEEITYLENQAPSQHLSIKLPWYDKDDKILGIFGFAIELGKQPLSKSLSLITGMGFVLPFKTQMRSLQQALALEAEQIYLTPREAELIKLIIRGMRAPEIASYMKLSKRTIEHYILSIKEKFHVKTKHELIERVINFMSAYHIKDE